MPCVVHVGGAAFDPQSFLQVGSLSPYSIFRQGDPCGRSSTRCFDYSGFKLAIGSDDCWVIDQQVDDCAIFFEANRVEFERVASEPGIGVRTIDFGIQGMGICTEVDLPKEFMRLVVGFKFDVRISFYACGG